MYAVPTADEKTALIDDKTAVIAADDDKTAVVPPAVDTLIRQTG